MSSKDNIIIDKVSGSVNEALRLVDVTLEVRNKLRNKTKRYGSKELIRSKTKIDPRTIRRVIRGERIRKGNLETIVKWLISPDANVEDYIKEVI